MSQALKPLLPGSTLGVLGGGQLGRMWAHTAQRMGFHTAVLDPDAQSPAGLVSHHHIHTDYLDAAGLKQLAAVCQAVTTEFENVPAATIDALAALAWWASRGPKPFTPALVEERTIQVDNPFSAAWLADTLTLDSPTLEVFVVA